MGEVVEVGRVVSLSNVGLQLNSTQLNSTQLQRNKTHLLPVVADSAAAAVVLLPAESSSSSLLLLLLPGVRLALLCMAEPAPCSALALSLLCCVVLCCVGGGWLVRAVLGCLLNSMQLNATQNKTTQNKTQQNSTKPHLLPVVADSARARLVSSSSAASAVALALALGAVTADVTGLAAGVTSAIRLDECYVVVVRTVDLIFILYFCQVWRGRSDRNP